MWKKYFCFVQKLTPENSEKMRLLQKAAVNKAISPTVRLQSLNSQPTKESSYEVFKKLQHNFEVLTKDECINSQLKGTFKNVIEI